MTDHSLTNSNLNNITLDGVHLNDANIQGTDLENLNLNGLDLDGIDLDGMNLNGTDGFADAFNDTLYENFNEGYYIGIMSGTSLDALDLVVVNFIQENSNGETDTSQDSQVRTKVNMVATLTKDFDAGLKTVLMALCQPNATNTLVKDLVDNKFTIDNPIFTNMNTEALVQMSELDWFGWASRIYAEFVSDTVLELLATNNLTADNILAIGCHGQTVRHRPEHGFTLQLVDPNIIAERTAISVISDFRRRDMAVGGQGAPLVPAFHQAFFSSNHHTNIILNLGGIANITVLPMINSSENQKVIGYDTGPANLLLDAWISKHTPHSFDRNGDFARSGTIIAELLVDLLAHPYFSQSAPKSTGREDFHITWFENKLTSFNQKHTDIKYTSADIQATLTELTAISVVKEINYQSTTGNLYLCGGGAFNSYLVERITQHLNGWSVYSSKNLGINPIWVEAIAFAWLAQQTLIGETGNLPSVTGARKAVVLGVLALA